MAGGQELGKLLPGPVPQEGGGHGEVFGKGQQQLEEPAGPEQAGQVLGMEPHPVGVDGGGGIAQAGQLSGQGMGQLVRGAKLRLHREGQAGKGMLLQV